MPQSEPLSVQAAQKTDRQQDEAAYEKARDFFYSVPLRLANAQPSPVTPSYDTNSQGTVQFQLIGQVPTDPAYSDIMYQNASILFDIGGLIFDYMHTHYPVVNTAKLDVNTWQNVVAKIPDLAIGSAVEKKYNNNVKGVQIAAEFLSLVAKALLRRALPCQLISLAT
jgi:Virulence factor Evf